MREIGEAQDHIDALFLDAQRYGAAEIVERQRLAALRQIESAKRELHWAAKLRSDLAKENKERRALEAANRTSEDPTLRARLHRLQLLLVAAEHGDMMPRNAIAACTAAWPRPSSSSTSRKPSRGAS